jgi:hypothetical protein
MTDPLAFLSDTAKHWGDALSIGGLVASLLGWLPGVTALLVLVWTGMRIYECYLNIRLRHRELEK